MFIFYIIILLIATFILIAYVLSGVVIHPKTISLEKTIQNEIEIGGLRIGEYEKKVGKENYIKSDYGYNLYIKEYKSKDNKGTIIILHGITYTHAGSIKLVDMFLEYGLNVIVFDNRNHGNSGGKNTTYGFYEKYDTKKIVDYIEKKDGSNKPIGLHGTSMGAAIALETVKIDNRISFVISDCAYSDLNQQLLSRAKIDYKIKLMPLYELAKRFIKLRAKFEINKVSPIDNLENINCRVLFIHGDNDKYIDKQMALNMYEKNRKRFDLYLSPNAGHAMSYIENRIEYKIKVYDFLNYIFG